MRKRTVVDHFEPFAAYVRQRLGDDPHLWASTLYDELLGLGYDRSYPSMTRAIRARGLRPACEACRPAKGRAVAVIEHPPGQETQWDWVELPDPPEHWGGARPRTCSSAPSHTPVAGEGCCVSRWSNPTSSTPWTGSPGPWGA